MPIFWPLASLVWPENEVMDGQAVLGVKRNERVNHNNERANHNDFSIFPPSLCSGGISIFLVQIF